MTEPPLRLGTRGSTLALAQAKLVAKAVGDSEIVTIKTADADVGCLLYTSDAADE